MLPVNNLPYGKPFIQCHLKLNYNNFLMSKHLKEYRETFIKVRGNIRYYRNLKLLLFSRKKRYNVTKFGIFVT